MFYVVKWVETPANPTMEPYTRGPYLVEKGRRNGEATLEWFMGGYMSWPDNVQVLKTYPSRDSDQAELDFILEFCPVQAAPELELTCGWLSPEGKLYPCEYAEHDELGRRIATRLWKQLKGVPDLEQAGWLRITEAGVFSSRKYGGKAPTQAQLDTVLDLYRLSEGTEWEYGFRQFLELCED